MNNIYSSVVIGLGRIGAIYPSKKIPRNHTAAYINHQNINLIAGIDPEDASIGSVAWSSYLVDGDLGHEIDAREMPEDWLLAQRRLLRVELEAAAVDGEVTVPARKLVDICKSLPEGSTIEFSLEAGKATVEAFASVPKDDRIARCSGNEIIVEISSRRYSSSPMVLQGPGAGLQITAAGLFADLLRVSRSLVEWNLPTNSEYFVD